MQVSSSSDKSAVPMASSKNYCERDETRECAIANANYQKVLTVLDRCLRDDRCAVCRCEKCISDMTALALNFLPPHYYVDAGRGGDIGSPSVMVESAVIEAMKTVVKNPRHEK